MFSRQLPWTKREGKARAAGSPARAEILNLLEPARGNTAVS